MSDDRIEIEPDESGDLQDIWIAGQPVGKLLNSLYDRVDQLEKENSRLKERVGELEAQADPNPQAKEYNEMGRDERVRHIREALVGRAQRSHGGRAKMTYKDVLLLFDNHPSDGYAYKLMKLAGQEDGFDYADEGERRIRVNLAAVNDDALFHTVNKTTQEEPA